MTVCRQVPAVEIIEPRLVTSTGAPTISFYDFAHRDDLRLATFQNHAIAGPHVGHAGLVLAIPNEGKAVLEEPRGIISLVGA